jgi:uncharacterized protein YjdB
MKNITARAHPFGIRSAVLLAVLGLMPFAVGCEDDGPSGLDDEVASVTLASASQTIEIGSTHQLTFEIRDDAGNLIDTDDVTIDFSSNTPTVATVSETGLVTPVAAGTAVVTIEVGSVSDTITINVIAEISSIDIVEAGLDLITGETLSFNITVLDAEGDHVMNPSLTFTSTNAAVVSVDDEQRVTGEGEGTARVRVEGGGESDSVDVTVFAAASGGLSATGSSFVVSIGDELVINDLFVVRDAGGVIIPDAELVFTTTNEAVVTVDATGLLTAVVSASGGTALVTATSPEATGSATVRVSALIPLDLAILEIEPATATVAVGATVDLDVAGESATGDPQGDVLAVFASSNEAVATVSPLTGVVTGVAAGTATITATSGVLTAQSAITVE